VSDEQASAARIHLVQRLADMIERRRVDHRVAIDGPDAAGKTILADEVAPALAARGGRTIRASIDGFHRPRADRYRRGPDSPYGYYEDSFDYEGLRRFYSFPSVPGAAASTNSLPSTTQAVLLSPHRRSSHRMMRSWSSMVFSYFAPSCSMYGTSVSSLQQAST
jgi:hypothetical protein